MLSLLASWRAFVTAALLSACSCETLPPVVPTDTPPRDGGPRPDVPRMDAPLADGEVPDGPAGDGGFDVTTCSVPSEDVLELATDGRMRERIVGVGAGASSWAVAWTENVGGLDEVKVAAVGPTGIPIPRQITTLNALTRDPVVVARADGWLLAWSGNHERNFEIYSQALGADLSNAGLMQRLTTNTELDQGPSLVPLPTSGFLAAWVEARGLMDNLAWTRALDANGVPTGAARMVTTMDRSVDRPALTERSAGAVMAWAEGGATPPETYVLALDAVGGTSGAPMVVGSEGAANGFVDVATGPLQAAIVYGVTLAGRRELRIRLLDGTGTPIDTPRAATPDTGADASIAAFGGGFVVSYRTTAASPEVRLAFLDELGAYVGEIPVAMTTPMGGRTTVRVTTDGRILVAWAELSATFTRVRAARVRCE